jgi:hypothetical protein
VLGKRRLDGRSQTVAEVRIDVDQVLDRLLGRAFLFDDPSAFEAGVREAVELLATAGAGMAPAGRGAHGEVGDSDRVVRGA